MNTKALRQAVSQYAKPSNQQALFLFVMDISLYGLAIAGTIFLENMMLRVACALFAGLRIGTLFLIAHDSGHDSYTSSRLMNKIIGRIAFLPSFHNFSLWLIAHNRSHHQSPNVKGLNSWSPMSKAEYDSLPRWRQVLESIYRTPMGISLNYTIERWWKDKFYPYNRVVENHKNLSYWSDFALVVAYIIGFTAILVYSGLTLSHTNPAEVLLLAMVIPFFFGNFLIGLTIYQHHTHETIPWFSSVEEFRAYGDQKDVTIHVKFPDWYNVISNNSMIHTAHHIDPRIPLYNLAKAQEVLYELEGDDIINMDFSLFRFMDTMKNCKLYDYENHVWTDFNGNPTSDRTVFVIEPEYKQAA